MKRPNDDEGWYVAFLAFFMGANHGSETTLPLPRRKFDNGYQISMIPLAETIPVKRLAFMLWKLPLLRHFFDDSINEAVLLCFFGRHKSVPVGVLFDSGKVMTSVSY